MTISLNFCGAAGTVTGSCYLIHHPGGRFLVDCGMFQGAKTLRTLNYRDFPFDPAKIDYVLLTHAHIDHSGLLPKLTKAGFGGRIIATAGSRDLLSFMLPDSAQIQESEVERLNRRNQQRSREAVQPIYGQADAEAALSQIVAVGLERWIDCGPGVRARFWNAGHILGAASIVPATRSSTPTPTRRRISTISSSKRPMATATGRRSPRRRAAHCCIGK